LIKIGIIIDKYHLENKAQHFLEYLRTRAKVSLYVEEDYVVDYSKDKFDEDLFFIKAKGDLVLNLGKKICKDTNIPIINSPGAIWLSYNRFLNSVYLQKAGIKVPRFAIIPRGYIPPFENFIIKNVQDQQNYVFDPLINESGMKKTIADKRALNEVYGTSKKYNFFYYQEFIDSEWEYKVYTIGNDTYFYKQVPVLVNPNKMKSRVKIEPIEELREKAFVAARAIGLKISSMDFLQSKNGEFYLSDINSSPNFNYIQDGPNLVANFLIKEARC
jgi:glutathione synthase/RimK-type ligase-like ATP-grasp enzyme